MKNLLWSGPRESDISGLESLFCASTTIFGSNENNNHSYTADIGIRIDHNQPESLPDEYCNEKIAAWIEKYPDLKILYYNPLYSRGLLPDYQKRVVGCNDLALLKLLDSKSTVRKIANKQIPVVPYQQVANLQQLYSAMPKLEAGLQYILQENHSSGGAGTHIVDKQNIRKIIDSFNPEKAYFVSPYIENSISVNIHCILFDDGIAILPGSIQLMKTIDNKILYMGADFIAYQSLPQAAKTDIRNCGEKLCLTLHKMGYRGVLGIDSLLIDQHAYFLEVNARFQASTPLLNKALKEEKLPSIQELHLDAFYKKAHPDLNVLERISVSYSMACYTEESGKKDIECFCNLPKTEAGELVLDGYHSLIPTKKGAYLFHVIFQTNLCSLNPDGGIWIYENLYDVEDSFSAEIYKKNPLNVKISLLNQGVVITKDAETILKSRGEIRNAVFSAIDITILDGLSVNCPSDVKFVILSPWRIDQKEDALFLYYHGTEISVVSVDMENPYASRHTQSGIPFKTISFWATDRMRIHHTVSCIFKKCNQGCRFCEIPKSFNTCSLDDIYEVIDFYLENENEFRHFLIGGGSESFDQEALRIAKITKHIRSKCDKPIYLMCLPPKDLSVLHIWQDAGVTEVAFNIELFDRTLAKQFMPGKGQIPLMQYLSALEAATELWGKSGNVRTIFLAGLEKKETLLHGIEAVASLGVMPILSVFRPLRGTETEAFVPPSNEWLASLFQDGEHICKKYFLHLGPSCPACQNNTLSLPFLSLSE